nr:reverse transcriptase domain-containing protein [Tanacetum cinerariifolium]
MMTRLDDFVRSKEAFASTKLPKGEASKASKSQQDRSTEGNTGSTGEATELIDEEMKEEARLITRTGWYRIVLKPHIRHLASEPHLNLQPPRPMRFLPKKENQDKYCDSHGEKAHYTNDWFQLRRQLEMALESGKLNHLFKIVRQRGRDSAKGRNAEKDKVTNMIRSWPHDRKRKLVERDESWMKALIVFPLLPIEDASDEPLIIEAVMEGYLVRRVYVDQRASMEVMFEHCFENLSPDIRTCLRGTQMDLVGFARGVVKPLGKIKLEVIFEDGGLFRTVMINFTVVRAPSPYNVIFGRTGLRSLRAVSSTIHFMVKFPTPRGIATLVTRSAIISECRRLERKKMVEQEVNQNINQEKEVSKRVDLTEQTLVNPTYPDQLVTIEGDLSEQCFRHKCFLDAYKGYHQVQMAQDDEEKIAFCTDQGTLVDTTFQSHIGRNLEAYVDDMVIKNNDEKVLIEDIAETFDNLQRIKMKLNPEKCSFGLEKGKFLGYMVTSEGIRANPKKTKSIVDMQSHRIFKKMQSLSGKLAALKRFLTRSAKKSLPFFETLKDITKENKDEYCWTESAKKAFQEMKKDVKQSREDLCPVGKISPVIVAHVQEVTENNKGSRAGLVLISPSGVEFMYAFRLNFTSKNSKAKYKALLARLHMARKIKVQNIDVKVDSKLVASQINGSYVASSTSMIKYLATTKECIAEFKTFAIQNIPRNLNQKADIFSKLAAHAFDQLTNKVLVEVPAERLTDRNKVGAIVEEEDNWMTPIICCLAEGVWPKDKDERRAIRMKINQYVLEEGFCEMHIGARSVVAKSIRQANGLVERANKSLIEGIKARLERERTGWVDELPKERREAMAIREAKYKTKMEQYYNQKVRLMSFKLDEYVFLRKKASRVEDQGKLGPKWEGPYRSIG